MKKFFDRQMRDNIKELIEDKKSKQGTKANAGSN